MLSSSLAPTVITFSLALGVLSGFLGGLIGIGGGFILVPGLFVLFQLSFKMPTATALLFAAGTAMAGIGLISLISTYMNHRRKAVLWGVYKRIAPGLLFGAGVGAYAATQLDTHYMRWAFAAFCFYVGLRMVFSYATEPSPDATLRTTHATPYGFGFGVFSGLVGVGCATLIFSFLTKRQAQTRNALATASALQFPVSLGATLSYVIFGGMDHLTTGADPFTGFVSFPLVGLIGLGAILGTPLGVRVSHALHTDILKRIFGVVALIIGVHMSGVFEDKKPTKPLKPAATTQAVQPATSEPESLNQEVFVDELLPEEKKDDKLSPSGKADKSKRLNPRDIR